MVPQALGNSALCLRRHPDMENPPSLIVDYIHSFLVGRANGDSLGWERRAWGANHVEEQRFDFSLLFRHSVTPPTTTAYRPLVTAYCLLPTAYCLLHLPEHEPGIRLRRLAIEHRAASYDQVHAQGGYVGDVVAGYPTIYAQ